MRVVAFQEEPDDQIRIDLPQSEIDKLNFNRVIEYKYLFTRFVISSFRFLF